jgi:16S rRNA (cytosine967-C5)-methyltransferase
LDTPAWLWASWGSDARRIATAHHREAPLDITLKPSAAMPAGGEVLANGSVRFPAGTRVLDLPGFGAGDFWVQDMAASLPAALLAPQKGELIADLCAAPGGKTAQLAAAGARVVAVERDPARMQRLQENMARLGLDVDMRVQDAAETLPNEGAYDAVLLDAPCSATGTIRRHPDLMHIKRATDVQAMVAAQDRLLQAASRLLRPGGRLVYAVCSLQPEEGTPRVDRAAGKFGLIRDPIAADEVPELSDAITPHGFLRTHPGMWDDQGGMDGFFIARLTKPA